MTSAGSVSMRVDIDHDFLSSILITAFDGNYGGSWYWATPAMDDWLKISDDGSEWLSVYITEREDSSGNQWMVTQGGILYALQYMLDNGKMDSDTLTAIREGDAGYIDADQADAIVQYCVFGELVYG